MRRFNLKKIAIVLGISGVVIWGGSVTFAKMIEKHNIKVNQAIAQQKKEQEEAEAKKPIIGVNEEGKKYTYDAKKVQEKLNNHDYTNDGKKVVFLTFDDGTSKTNTPEVLRILKENNIKATFFLTGSNIENGGETARELVKQEFESGHAIANHSYSHDCGKLYPGRNLDMKAFKEDYEKNYPFYRMRAAVCGYSPLPELQACHRSPCRRQQRRTHLQAAPECGKRFRSDGMVRIL